MPLNGVESYRAYSEMPRRFLAWRWLVVESIGGCRGGEPQLAERKLCRTGGKRCLPGEAIRALHELQEDIFCDKAPCLTHRIELACFECSIA